jgi:hypothetical protein
MSPRWIALATLLAAGAAHASPPALDALLCRRADTRFSQANRIYLSVARGAPQAPGVSATDEGMVTVCQDAAKKQCASFAAADRFAADTAAINPEGTLLLASGPQHAVIASAKDGKVVRKLSNQRSKHYSCGGGLWLGDTILAYGQDCEEFDALPYLAHAKTGKFIAPLVDKHFTQDGETLYDAVPLEGKRWAIAVFNHNYDDGIGLGQVFVIDVKTGKVHATATGAKEGGASITEGKLARALDKIPPCAP